ncbi:MAG: hypothetical protein AAFZ38_11640 [Myxococcota bacterium]
MKIEERELASNIRRRVFEVLELISDERSQRSYQDRAPMVQVSSELFNQWEEVHHPDTEEWRLAFGPDERSVLRSFNSTFEEVCEATPQLLPSLSEFMDTESWRIYRDAAKSALEELGPIERR